MQLQARMACWCGVLPPVLYTLCWSWHLRHYPAHPVLLPVHLRTAASPCKLYIHKYICKLAQCGSVQESGVCECSINRVAVLQDMGFIDRAENIRALQAVNGNVNAAVERLLSGV